MKRLFPFVLLILVLLAGIIGIPYLLRPEGHRKEITDRLSALLKRPVVLGPMSMGYLPPSLNIEQVLVSSDAGAPVIQIGVVSAPLDWAALFHLQLAVQDVELNHWKLFVQRKANGHWDLEDWLPQVSGFSGAKTWTLREVRWKDGEIHWTDSFAAAPQELILSSVEGHWDPRPETMDAKGTFSSVVTGTQISFTGKGQFFANPNWSGDLQFSDQGNAAAFHITKAANSTDVKGQATRWRLDNALSVVKFYTRAAVSTIDNSGSLALESWQLHVSAQGGHLTFDHSAGISGGLTEAKGSVEPGPVLHADMAAKDVPVAAFLELAGEKVPLDGKATLVTKGFEMALSSSALSSISGEGSIEIKDGSYRLPDSPVKKLAKAKTMAYIKQKFPDLDQKGVAFTKLSVRWKAKGGVATVDDARLTAPDIKAAWVGKIDLAKSGMDGFVRLSIHEKDPKKRSLLPQKYLTQPATGRLQGSWQEWGLRAVPSSKVPPAVQAKLRKALGS